MTPNLKKKLIALVTFLGGLYFFLVYVIPIPDEQLVLGFPFSTVHEQMIFAVQVVGIMAIGLGLINIFQVHGGRILYLRKDWLNSAALIAGLCITMFVQVQDLITTERTVQAWKQFSLLSQFVSAIAEESQSTSIAETRLLALDEKLQGIGRKLNQERHLLSVASHEAFGTPPAAAFKGDLERVEVQLASLLEAVRTAPDLQNLKPQFVELSTQLRVVGSSAQKVVTINSKGNTWKNLSRVIQEGFFVPLGASMFALLAFYIAGAAYRAFRVRTLEAGLMMLAALIVILGQIPQGAAYISEDLPGIRKWLLDNISTPAFRAISFGAAIAGLAMAVRMWLSLERSPLEVDEKSTRDTRSAKE